MEMEIWPVSFHAFENAKEKKKQQELKFAVVYHLFMLLNMPNH